MVVGMERVGVAIPPVVARIFSGDSTSPLTREARTWCEARDGADAKQAERLLKGKDVVLSEGLLYFCNGCEGGEVRCNGRGKPLALRKVGGIVRKISLMVGMGSNPHRLDGRET